MCPLEWLQSMGNRILLPSSANMCAGITHTSPSHAGVPSVRLQSPTGFAQNMPPAAKNNMPCELFRHTWLRPCAAHGSNVSADRSLTAVAVKQAEPTESVKLARPGGFEGSGGDAIATLPRGSTRLLAPLISAEIGDHARFVSESSYTRVGHTGPVWAST
jgi:hypothetical protein|eukprot:COSAG01_NODE_22432_length_855_cov_259.019841_1_plen_160_part_00